MVCEHCGKITHDGFPCTCRAEKSSELYLNLIHTRIPDDMLRVDVIDAFLKSTMVAAEIEYDEEFHKKIFLTIAEKSADQIAKRKT